MHNKPDSVPQTLRRIHTNSNRLMLATGQATQTPYVCQVPYVWANEAYCVWIADVTEAIRHLRLAKESSVMLLEHGHGQQCAQLVWIVEASEVVYRSPEYRELLQAVCTRTGMDLQAALNMECQALYRLRPVQGRLMTDLNEIVALIAADLQDALASPKQKPTALAIG